MDSKIIKQTAYELFGIAPGRSPPSPPSPHPVPHRLP